ncbi:MAG: hypothetical protein AUJ07_10500 [Crenarchaeota archaeon 13_1_40CM_3_53_5]|nr:MAG: hypothetical protein AUJ07_10500 [Crenarchaeota archaeon 13_1_40CM_3_53_5]
MRGRYEAKTINNRTIRCTLAITLVILATTMTVAAHGDYVVKVTTNNVTVSISGDLLQAVPNSSANNTADRFTKIPLFQFHLGDQNSSTISADLNTAFKQLSPTASVTQVVLDAVSNGTSVHYDLNFKVSGITNDHGTAESIDLKWKSFVITEDFKVGNITLNGAVPDYLGGQISAFARLSPATGPPLVERRMWYWNGELLPPNEVAPTVAGLFVLNFTGLSKPIETWTPSAELHSQSYLYKASTGFNLTQITQVIEAEGTTNFARDLIYKVNTVISAPWGSTASGDTLFFEGDPGWGNWIMVGAISSALIVLFATLVYENGLLRSQNNTRTRTGRRRPSTQQK